MRCFGTDISRTGCQDIPEEASYEDNDGLGYYSDGVKRTLTDEQVAIFRHSEIQAILRERRHERESSFSSQHRGVDVEAAKEDHNDSVERESVSVLEDEDEYTRFLEQEQEQLRKDTAVKKRKRGGNSDGTRRYHRAEGGTNSTELERHRVPYEGLDYDDDTAVSEPTVQVVGEQRKHLERERKRVVYENEEGIDAVNLIAAGDLGFAPEAKKFLWPQIHI